MQEPACVPYKRKSLYLILTLPMIVLYIALAIFLWRINVLWFVLYVALFILVALFMSYVCVYWQCPYVGKFAPCVGGFCLPSSRLALLFKNAKRSKTRYTVFLNGAYVSFVGIILFPMYFLFQKHVGYLVRYTGVVVIYGILFMLFICPVCGTNHICPGGQAAVKIKQAIDSWSSRST